MLYLYSLLWVTLVVGFQIVTLWFKNEWFVDLVQEELVTAAIVVLSDSRPPWGYKTYIPTDKRYLLI